MKDPTGRYHFLRRIGRGGMGQVWAGLRLGKEVVSPVAIKVLHPDLAETRREKERFLDEGRIAGMLDHGRIVKVLDTGEVQGCPFRVMEWVDSVNVRDLVERVREHGDRLDLNVSLFVVGEVLAALQYAHERRVDGHDAGVIHSDVTPANILISSAGEVKLTDFGIARFAMAGPLSRAVGTPRYMAPEQMTGHPRRESDIYTLGVVLHELISGTRYLEGYSEDHWRAVVMQGPPAPLDASIEVPEWIRDLRTSMLQVDPKRRPRAADARVRILEHAERYQTATLDLEKLYAKVVGDKRSGATEIMKRQGARGVGVAGPVELSVGPGEPAVQTQTDPTVADDAVPVFRHRSGHTPPPLTTPPSLRATTHTRIPSGADIPVTELLPPESQAPALTAQVEPAFFADSGGGGASQFDLAADQPLAAAPAVALAAPEPSAIAAPAGQTSAQQLAPPAAVAAPPTATPRRRLIVLLAVLLPVLVVSSAVLLWVVIKRPRTPDPTAQAQAADALPKRPTEADATDEPPPSSPEELVTGAQPTPPSSEPTAAKAAPKDPDPPELDPAPSPQQAELAPAPKPESKPEPALQPKPKPQPKPRPAAREEVVIMIKGVKTGEIKLGSRVHKLDEAVFVRLRPASYSVAWRPAGTESWTTTSQKLRIEPLDKGYYVDVKIDGGKLFQRARKQGGGK